MAYASIEHMRYIVSKAYSGPRWKENVKHMSDNQVIALYYKFQGTINRLRPPERKVTKPVEPPKVKSYEYQPQQLSIDDYLRMKEE